MGKAVTGQGAMEMEKEMGKDEGWGYSSRRREEEHGG